MLQDIVIGLSDGLTVPFALAAGLSGAVQSSGLVSTVGLAEIVAGSIARGLGGYLAGRTEVGHYAAKLAREHEEVRTLPATKRREVQKLFAAMGLSEATAAQASAELVQDPAQWVRFMMKYELGLEEPDPRQALKSAFTIAGVYALGGLIPLSAYLLTAAPAEGLRWSGVSTLVCLLVFGFFKSRLTGQVPLAGALKMAATGAAAAGAAYYVARLVQGGWWVPGGGAPPPGSGWGAARRAIFRYAAPTSASAGRASKYHQRLLVHQHRLRAAAGGV